MNEKLAQQVLTQIELHPETWDQTNWRCSTGKCFAGWASELAGYEWAYPEEYSSEVLVTENHPALLGHPSYYNTDYRTGMKVVGVSQVARHALGITANQSNELFHEDNDLEDIEEILTMIEEGVEFPTPASRQEPNDEPYSEGY